MSEVSDRERMGVVTVEGEYATIVFKRVLGHSPERVWEAITRPEELKEWLMCTSGTVEGWVGGRVEMVSGPAQFHVTGRVLAWDPPRVYEHEWKVAPVGPMPCGEDAVFRYELTPQGEGTLLVVTYRRLTKQTAGGFAPGTHVLLDRLEAQLDGRELPGWMGRFEALRQIYLQ